VAKTRRSRKAAGAKKRRVTTRKRPSRRKKAAVARSLDLANLRGQLQRAIDGLETRRESASVAEARVRLSRWMSDIDDFCTEEMQEICGPTMAIPLA
jgi:hypothetical protein